MNSMHTTEEEKDKWASQLTHYLQHEAQSTLPWEELLQDNDQAVWADEVLKSHWDAIPLVYADETVDIRWKVMQQSLAKRAPRPKPRYNLWKRLSFPLAASIIVGVGLCAYWFVPHDMSQPSAPATQLSQTHREIQQKAAPQLRLQPQPQPQSQSQPQQAPVPQSPVGVDVQGETTVVIPVQAMAQPTDEAPAQPSEKHEYATGMGEELNLTLADGTAVRVFENSRLTCIDDESDSTRQVHLSGKAHFEVAHNPSKPFLVQGEQVSVRVLGTAFGVSAYAGQLYATVKVDRGKVKVSTPDDMRFTVAAGQELVYNTHTHTVSILNQADGREKKIRKKS